MPTPPDLKKIIALAFLKATYSTEHCYEYEYCYAYIRIIKHIEIALDVN